MIEGGHIDQMLSRAGRVCRAKSAKAGTHDWLLLYRHPAAEPGHFNVKFACARKGCRMWYEMQSVPMHRLRSLGVEVPEAGP